MARKYIPRKRLVGLQDRKQKKPSAFQIKENNLWNSFFECYNCGNRKSKEMGKLCRDCGGEKPDSNWGKI